MKPFSTALFLFIVIILQSIISNSVFSQNQDTEEIIKNPDKNIYIINDIKIDKNEKSITIPCKINMNSGLLEVVLCRPEGKVHESLLTTDISPVEFQTALLLLGYDPVNELPENLSDADPLSPYNTIETSGDSVLIFIEWQNEKGKHLDRIEKFIRNEEMSKELKPSTWLFRGAVTHKSGYVIVDPDVTMIATYHDPIAMMELNSPTKFNDELYYVNEELNLTKGDKVKLILKPVK